MGELDIEAVAHRDHRWNVDNTTFADRVRVVSDLAKDFIAREAFGPFLLGTLLLVTLGAQLGLHV